jgi:DNA-directed RNA polymerase subunit K/omega
MALRGSIVACSFIGVIGNVSFDKEMTMVGISYAELMQSVKKAGSAPLLINIISKRVRQLQRGAKPLLENRARMSELTVAITEYLQDKIGYKPRS